jgi:small basic protein (TIGR04137 family)
MPVDGGQLTIFESNYFEKSRSAVAMTMDKSLRVRLGLARARSVLSRAERIQRLKESDRWKDGNSPFGLAKVRVFKLEMKKKKKKKEEGEEGAEGAAGTAAAPAAAAPAADAKKDAGKGAKGGKGGKK